ncbi:ABC transporter permease [Phytomonospora endophytica]|uniref:ABC-type transport system involved in multi-copper enzyme maturation permease subunit n=1 Tax=Phytomonospora endophytica TaxID=714109 RepID=A0A841FU90_9ACTN|nr:ABC transporter permease [Phytomonospora endophytica]MBB6037112.1 ABC-type transport system involved in multi-copper enzyme maturation permease subunit [Phytomonospora endophytica]GIG71151.1 ABC transporter permease [Phytomonospora endophytica]
MTGLISAEWLKLHSVRSTRIVAAVIAASIAGGAALTWYVASMWDKMSPADREHLSISSVEELTLSVNQLCFAVLGILAMTGEYRTGLIRSTFAATPARGKVLAAKAIVLGVCALVVGTATSLLTYAVCDAIIGERPIRFYDQPVDLTALLTAGPSTLMFALIGLGLGTALRSSAGAIAAVVALWYVLPIVAMNLPSPWDNRIGAVLLTRLDPQLAGVDLAAKYGADGMPGLLLSPAGAAAVMAAYTLAALIPATLSLRRDTR